MPREEVVTGRAGFEEIEVEMVIRGPPPQWCSCKCPEYNRDPCLACEIRPVKSIDRGSLGRDPGGELYFIPRSEIDRILNERKGEVKVHEEFREAFREGKLEADSKVEASLFTRAIGFEYTEKKVTTFSNGDMRTEETTKKVLPDVTAQIFWLKNRKPHEWRDKHEHTGEDGGPVEIIIRRA